MVTKVSPEKKERIRHLLIQGESWGMIEKKTGSGKSTIKTINQELLSSLQKEIKTSIESLQVESSKSITDTAATAQAGLQSIVTSLDDKIAEISRYSESFGKLQSLRPLFDIMAGKKDCDPLETYLATDTYLGNFLKWLDPTKTFVMLPAKRLREAIEREARLLNPRQTR